jgi:hypothetical protein
MVPPELFGRRSASWWWMTWLLMEFQKILEMQLLIWMFIKASNPACMTLT